MSEKGKSPGPEVVRARMGKSEFKIPKVPKTKRPSSSASRSTQRRQESGDSSDSSTRNNSKSRLPQYDINHNWQKIPKPYEGDATGTAQMRHFFESKYPKEAMRQCGMSPDVIEDFVFNKCENMMKAWAACDYKHTDLRRDFLAAPVAQRGLSYEDPESVQRKWLNMLEAKRPQLRDLGVNPHLLVISTLGYLNDAYKDHKDLEELHGCTDIFAQELKRVEDADARMMFVSWPYAAACSKTYPWDEGTELEIKHKLYDQCASIKVIEFMKRRPDELPMAKLMFNSVEEKKDAEIKIRTRELNVEGQFPLTIKYMSLKPKNSPLLKGKVVGNQLLVKNVFFDFSDSQEQAESELKSHLTGVIKVKSARQHCSFYVTFSDSMKALDAFGKSGELQLNEGRVLVLFARQKEFSF